MLSGIGPRSRISSGLVRHAVPLRKVEGRLSQEHQLLPGDTSAIFVASSEPWPGHFIEAGLSLPKAALDRGEWN
jgi:hypothetical protein